MKRQSTKKIFRFTGAKDRAVATLTIGAALALGFTSAAMAEPPANDEQSSATLVEMIGFSETIDTTDATTAPDDPYCAGQGPTVWYSFTPTETTFIGANTFGSEYDTTLSAYVVDDLGIVSIACNDDANGTAQSRIRFEAEAGVTYLFMVGSFFDGPGGIMTFNLVQGFAPVQIQLAIDSRGTVSPSTGTATLRGTVTCTGPADVYIYAGLRQRAGRFFVDGSGYSGPTACNGTTPWAAEVSSYNGLFAGGRADATVSAEVPEDYSYDYGSATVRLVGSRRSRR